ncbi:MAG: sulfatase family protein [Woeseiaceae bacterium]
MMKFHVAILTLLAMLCASCGQPEAERLPPNILWVNIDDQSPWYGTYGHELAQTPKIDALAETGVVFERAYAPSPVCAPSRSSVITGNYNIRIGAHDMRSGRVPEYQIHLPEGATTVPELFRDAGYETYNAGKDDFNFTYQRADLYSIRDPELESAGGKNYKGGHGSGDWRDVPDGKPFFGQVQISGGKAVDAELPAKLEALGYTPVNVEAVRVPPQYPDIPAVRKQIAGHYNSIMQSDHELGQLIERLKTEGLWQNTVVIIFSDHGSDLPRSKEYLYHEGLHVPLIIAAPGMQNVVAPGSRRSDIVNLMDISATSLALAGLDAPEYMDAENLFADDYSRDYVFSSADRMSNVIDRVRSVMGERFHYIRNFYTDRPLMNWGYREMYGLYDPDAFSSIHVRRMYEAGELTPEQAAPYGPRVAEELYDLQTDPDEVVNLAENPEYEAVLVEMRAQLSAWIEDTDDKGQYPRSAAAMKEVTDRMPADWLKSPEFAKEPELTE